MDSIYLGGGTPSVLAPDQLERIFQAVRENFDVEPTAEITVECAPGTISDEILEALLRCGVNRVSLGVQSFVDKESSSVGRLHTRAITLADIAPPAGQRHRQHQHRPDRWAASSDGAELGSFAGRNARHRRASRQRVHAGGG